MPNKSWKTDVYTTALISSFADAATALAYLGDGIQTGCLRWENDGGYGDCLFVLVRSGGAIENGMAAQLDISDSDTDGDLTVVKVAATGGGVMGWNNTGKKDGSAPLGGDVAADTYFWLKVWGLGYGYATDANLTDGADLMVSATDGEMDDWATTGHRCAVAKETPATDTLFDIFCSGTIGLGTDNDAATGGGPFGAVA